MIDYQLITSILPEKLIRLPADFQLFNKLRQFIKTWNTLIMSVFHNVPQCSAWKNGTLKLQVSQPGLTFLVSPIYFCSDFRNQRCYINWNNFWEAFPNNGIGFSSAFVADLRPVSQSSKNAAVADRRVMVTTTPGLIASKWQKAYTPNQIKIKARYSIRLCLRWKLLRLFLFGWWNPK